MPKGVFIILRDWYNNRAGRDDAKAMHKFERGEKVIEGQKRIAVPRRQPSITSKSTGGSAVSTPFSLRAKLKGVDVAQGVTLRYWEAGAGRGLGMLPGLGHAASLYKYQFWGLCDAVRVVGLDPRCHAR